MVRSLPDVTNARGSDSVHRGRFTIANYECQSVTVNGVFDTAIRTRSPPWYLPQQPGVVRRRRRCRSAALAQAAPAGRTVDARGPVAARGRALAIIGLDQWERQTHLDIKPFAAGPHLPGLLSTPDVSEMWVEQLQAQPTSESRRADRCAEKAQDVGLPEGLLRRLSADACHGYVSVRRRHGSRCPSGHHGSGIAVSRQHRGVVRESLGLDTRTDSVRYQDPGKPNGELKSRERS
ncbi:hypothetical protein FQA39_LY18885 [Lamprigera yunnana]|nr:hypothetical protein FQA39_LY18885 [Lamprigera yunnana]